MTHKLCLHGRRIPLVFTVNRVCMLEEYTGISIRQFLQTDFSALRGLLWCALPENDPDKGPPRTSLLAAGKILEDCLRNGTTPGALSALFARALRDCGFFVPTVERRRSSQALPR